jgi:hypothetical protein
MAIRLHVMPGPTQADRVQPVVQYIRDQGDDVDINSQKYGDALCRTGFMNC